MKRDTNPITRIRESLGWSKAEMSRRSGVAQASISHYESGLYLPPPRVVAHLIRAASLAGQRCTFDDIYGPLNLHRKPIRGTSKS